MTALWLYTQVFVQQKLKHATAISSVIRVCPSSFKADIRVHVCMSVKKGCDGGQAGLSDGNCANRMIDDM
eukprot:scaffold196077_cov18-Tisochrysis_lutea.AAC.4